MSINELAKFNKIVFVSEDGLNYKLFVDGKQLAITRGVDISAGLNEEVEVNVTLLAIPNQSTFK